VSWLLEFSDLVLQELDAFLVTSWGHALMVGVLEPLVFGELLDQLNEVSLERCHVKVGVGRNQAKAVGEVVKICLLGDGHGHLVGGCNACFDADSQGGQGTTECRGFAVLNVGGLVYHGTGAVFVCMACGTDAAFGITDDGTDAAAVGLQVNEFGFDAPIGVGFLVAEVEEALVDLHIVLAFDVGGFELVHGFWFRGF